MAGDVALYTYFVCTEYAFISLQHYLYFFRQTLTVEVGILILKNHGRIYGPKRRSLGLGLRLKLLRLPLDATRSPLYLLETRHLHGELRKGGEEVAGEAEHFQLFKLHHRARKLGQAVNIQPK